MKYIKHFENETSWDSEIKKQNRIYDEMQEFKRSLYEKMIPDPLEVWYIVDDCILELKDKYGKYTSKYNVSRNTIDFDCIDINVDIKKDTFYTIMTVSDWKWKHHGNRKEYVDAHPSTSNYGSSFDKQFMSYCKGKDIKPFYSILIGFESEYLSETNVDKGKCYKELGETLFSVINTLNKKYTTKIVSISALDNDWKKIPPTIDTLKNLKYPRVYLSFSVE